MRTKKYLLTILAIALSVIYLIPLIWMALASFQSQKDILAGKWIPSKWSTDNYKTILQRAKIGTWFINSLISSSIGTVGIIIICTLAAYAVSRMDFPGRKFLYILSLTGFMIPSQAIAIPLYLMIRKIGLVNNLLGIILPALPSSMAVFILSQFMKAIPADYEEAARLDGASELDIMFKIILPMSVPSIITVAVLHFTWIWNDFFLAFDRYDQRKNVYPTRWISSIGWLRRQHTLWSNNGGKCDGITTSYSGLSFYAEISNTWCSPEFKMKGV